jgi:hypothetical protein
MSRWHEIESIATVELLSLYSSESIVALRYDLERLGRAADAEYMRYENAHKLVADWVNDARQIDLGEFAKHSLDVWIGQRNEKGHFLQQMEVILAGPRVLPSDRLLRLLLRHPGLVSAVRGTPPIVLGAFPSVRISEGTVKHSWKLQRKFVTACSKWFREHHGLLKSARDPYVQMLAGAPEPMDFEWKQRRRKRKGT